ncbi:hypothetical protein C0989_008166 [Termitomyces sp. Mn162]|nr:hypothetical protein C0989_008166 [Termitomyces sp. Mn162]
MAELDRVRKREKMLKQALAACRRELAALSSPATTRRPAQAASNNAEDRDYVYAFGAGLHADSWFGAASSDKGGEISEDYREGRKRSQKV